MRMVHNNGSLSVSYDNPQLTRIDTDASSKPASHVRPDVAFAPAARAIESVGVGKPDGEEDEDDSRATFSLLMVRHRLPHCLPHCLPPHCCVPHCCVPL